MKKVEIIDKVNHWIYKDETFSSFQNMLRKHEAKCREYLNANPNVKHVWYGSRYSVDGEVKCWIEFQPISDEYLDKIIENASKLDDGILYVLHQR